MHHLKSSASCSAHSSNSLAWTSSCENVMGLSEGDDDDDLTSSAGSEPFPCRSTDQLSPARIRLPDSVECTRKTPDPESISSHDGKGEKACNIYRKGSQAGLRVHGKTYLNEEDRSIEEILASNESIDDGFYEQLRDGNGNLVFQEQEAGAPPSLSNNISGQGKVSTLNTQRDGMTGVRSNEQVLRTLIPHGWGGEDAQDELTDMYPPPRLRVQYRPDLPYDLSEKIYHRMRDTGSSSERDLYQPVERLEEATWHGGEFSDLSDHGERRAINHDCIHMLGKPVHSSSADRSQTSNGDVSNCEDLYNDKSHEWKPFPVPLSHGSNDKLAFSDCIHCVQELRPPILSSVISARYAQTAFSGSPVNAHNVSYPLCSVCHQDFNLKNHRFAHLPSLNQSCASASSVPPVCVAADSPHQHHWFPLQRIQVSQHLPPQATRRRGDIEEEQIVATRQRTKTRKPKRRPPYPSQGAAPYVLCQHCAQLLQAPVCSSPLPATTRKLRCGSCLRVSKFSVQHLRKPQMVPQSFADGARSSRDSSFHFPVASKQASSLRSGYGEESDFAAHDVSNFRSTDYIGSSSSPLRRRHCGNPDISSPAAVASKKIIPEQRFNPSGLQSEISERVGPSSSATSSVSNKNNRVNVTQWDSLEVTRVTGWTRSDIENDILFNNNQLFVGVTSKSAAFGEVGTGNCVLPSSNPVRHRAVAHLKDQHLPTDDVRESVSTAGFGTGNSVARRNDSHRQDVQVRMVSNTGLERYDTVEEHRHPAERPSSPLYKLLGYKSPADLSQMCPITLPESSVLDCPSYHDAYYFARVSDASNGGVGKPTFLPSTPDRDIDSPSKYCRSLEVSAAVVEFPEPKCKEPVGFAQVDDNPFSGKSSTASPKTLVKPDLAAAKFSTGFLRRSLIGLAQKGAPFSGNSRQKLIVNGHVLSSAAIKKAEQRAGILRPGCYWYDHKAGFWGVTGGPCVGILPPFIEEFNNSMAKDCSKGNTNVFVNGRELRLEDLDKLARRGLSKETSKSYEVSFDGTVIDATSGETLKSLGKLAPTVERRGKGCGMFMAPSGKL